MKPSRLQTFVEYLLDNLFDITTILVAGYLVIRYQLQPATPNEVADLLAGILTVLGLIAVSGLWDRNRRLSRIERLTEESRDLTSRYVNKKVRASDFFLSDHKLTEKDLASATKIYFLGKTLARTTREFMHITSQRLVAGADIRYAILDSKSESVLHEAVLRSYDAPIEYWRNSLQMVEIVIQATARAPGSKGKVEVGYLQCVPAFGIIMVDPEEPHGFCLVEVYHHKSPEVGMVFELRAKEDPYWYNFFKRQFDILWRSCRVESVPNTANSTKAGLS
jgi:hypothetical protein